jgi:hypothetical protein
VPRPERTERGPLLTKKDICRNCNFLPKIMALYSRYYFIVHNPKIEASVRASELFPSWRDLPPPFELAMLA